MKIVEEAAKLYPAAAAKTNWKDPVIQSVLEHNIHRHTDSGQVPDCSICFTPAQKVTGEKLVSDIKSAYELEYTCGHADKGIFAFPAPYGINPISGRRINTYSWLHPQFAKDNADFLYALHLVCAYEPHERSTPRVTRAEWGKQFARQYYAGYSGLCMLLPDFEAPFVFLGLPLPSVYLAYGVPAGIVAAITKKSIVIKQPTGSVTVDRNAVGLPFNAKEVTI